MGVKKLQHAYWNTPRINKSALGKKYNDSNNQGLHLQHDKAKQTPFTRPAPSDGNGLAQEPDSLLPRLSKGLPYLPHRILSSK